MHRIDHEARIDHANSGQPSGAAGPAGPVVLRELELPQITLPTLQADTCTLVVRRYRSKRPLMPLPRGWVVERTSARISNK